MNPWALVGAGVLAIGLTLGGYSKGRWDADASWKITLAEQAADADKREQELQRKADEITAQLQQERDAVRADLDAALERLRQRPERLPEPARAACKGSAGTELSRPDAGFLAREAARADELRAGLQACYQFLDSLTPN